MWWTVNSSVEDAQDNLSGGVGSSSITKGYGNNMSSFSKQNMPPSFLGTFFLLLFSKLLLTVRVESRERPTLLTAVS